MSVWNYSACVPLSRWFTGFVWLTQYKNWQLSKIRLISDQPRGDRFLHVASNHIHRGSCHSRYDAGLRSPKVTNCEYVSIFVQNKIKFAKVALFYLKEVIIFWITVLHAVLSWSSIRDNLIKNRKGSLFLATTSILFTPTPR